MKEWMKRERKRHCHDVGGHNRNLGRTGSKYLACGKGLEREIRGMSDFLRQTFR